MGPLKTSKIKEFTKRLEDINFEDADLIPRNEILEVDAELLSKDINFKLVKDLADFEPFGLSNPKPIFATFKMQLSDLRIVGNGKHLKFKADNIDVIAFGMGQMLGILQNGMYADVAYNLEIDNFRDQEKLQLKIKDIRIN